MSQPGPAAIVGSEPHIPFPTSGERSVGTDLRHEEIVAFDDDGLPGNGNDALLLKLVERHHHPLPRRTDDGGDLVVRDPALDDEAIAVAAAVVLGEDHEQLCQPLDDGAGAEHLGERGIAFALGDQSLDQAQRERGLRLDECGSRKFDPVGFAR